jgi:hypothetical protein
VALLDDIRTACADVAAVARHVALEDAAIPAYAAELAPPPAPGHADSAAFVLTLDAINFGSGWFPTLRKPAGRSGYRTIEAGLRARFAARGPWSPAELQALSAAEVAEALSQDPGHELMALFALSLNDLGAQVDRAGGWAELVAGDSAEALVERLAGWACFADVSAYGGRPVPFYKRAQIAAADLHRAGAARFGDLARLTMFADNLVPHVLRLDGVLRFDAALADRIEHEQLLVHGAREEVEIRACALHAVELLAAERPDLDPATIDAALWERGSGALYKARPRHRARCTAY